MFAQDDSSKFFCCESGQIGVDPLSGYAGVCEAADQVVPVSLRATMVPLSAFSMSPCLASEFLSLHARNLSAD